MAPAGDNTSRLRNACRIAVILFALGQAWTMRYVMNPDGTAYVDIAKAYLRREWQQALSTYWSPLYAWMMAAVLAVLHPRMENIIPLTHAVCFVEFLCALAAWEFLLREWEAWRGPAASPRLIIITGYLTFTWAAMHLVTLTFSSADIFVMALVLFETALLIRIHRGSAGTQDWVLVGAALGIGYLAKAAMMAMVPACVVTILLMRRRIFERQLLLTGAAAALVCGPFIAALSLHQGRITLGDTGTLNYAWLVNRYSVEGYKDNSTPGPVRIQRVLNEPEVLSYSAHIAGTMPPHSDPAWFNHDVKPHADPARQAAVLGENSVQLLIAFLACPALWLAIVALRGRGFRAPRELLLPVLPATGLLLAYALVYVNPRYIAGPFLVFAFVLLTGMWQWSATPRIRNVAGPLMCIAVAGVLWLEVSITGFYSLGEALGQVEPIDTGHVHVAAAMQQAGVRADDRVGYIGDALGAAWVGLLDAHVVATVPETLYETEEPTGRRLVATFGRTDRFWLATPAQQRAVLDAFRASGARWVAADEVPLWADMTGWKIAGHTHHFRTGDSDNVYYRRLDDDSLKAEGPTLSSR